MRKSIYFLMTSILIVVLSACGKSAKETYTEAYSELMDASSYESTSTIDLHLSSDSTNNTPDTQMILDMINNAEITLDTKVDMEQEISEIDFQVAMNQGPISFHLELPMQFNMENQRVYIATETISEAMMMFPVLPLPQDFTFDKEYIELDVSSEVDTEDQQQIEQQLREEINGTIRDLTEDAFIENNDTIELSLEGEDLQNIIASILEFSMEQSDEVIPDTDKKEVETILDAITFQHFNMKATIDGGKIVKEDISVAMDVEESNEKMEIAVDLSTEYKKINEPIDFNLKPTSENTMTQLELEEQLNEVMIDSMMNPSMGQ
ncbi:hypothetical protein [Aquibacillus albus]|uniref:Lipoprotein n=1 Tax=Aquibacillus albus TaxID=1168171 RepID=A0ABS2N5L2_9BACI|nr:hypothetical protein [Aquibacillus albus]MBM7573417.1 hypothetical protein [Aquibacillus albus]